MEIACQVDAAEFNAYKIVLAFLGATVLAFREAIVLAFERNTELRTADAAEAEKKRSSSRANITKSSRSNLEEEDAEIILLSFCFFFLNVTFECYLPFL